MSAKIWFIDSKFVAKPSVTELYAFLIISLTASSLVSESLNAVWISWNSSIGIGSLINSIASEPAIPSVFSSAKGFTFVVSCDARESSIEFKVSTFVVSSTLGDKLPSSLA